MTRSTLPEPTRAAVKPLQGERILVCEDEGIIVMQITRILREAGLEVVGSAMTGKESVEMALRERPPIILLDISMPEMDGFEVMEQIFVVYRPCIIILSAYDGDTKLKAREKGAMGYITKPMNSESLLYDLEAAVQSY